MFDFSVLTKEEETIFKLRSLYEKYGYSQYKMNKFEEYDLYVRNKDFLVSSNIISFTDTDGKLMALKPDVTLSIIKNSVDLKGGLQKLYYNENVYRVPKTDYSFKEIMQVGLECIGEVDDYSVFEVLLLAIKSLENISNDFVLDISHIGIVKEIIDALDLSLSQRQQVIQCISEKNTHDLLKINGAEKLCKLIETYGNLEKVGSVLDEFYKDKPSKSIKLLKDTVKALEECGYKHKVRIDFSVLNDMNYYSGIVFKGFVEGIPISVLSGGQYDYLMNKMGRKSNAIGFAVYLDMLEGFDESLTEYDVDTLVVYEQNASIDKIVRTTNQLISSGKSVMVKSQMPEKLKYKNLVEIKKEG